MATGHRAAIASRRSASIRLIEPSDAEALRAFYDELSPESRRCRFLGASRGITPAQAERFATELGVVAVLHERGPRDGALIGHACMPFVEPGVAEIAVAVADAQQGRGIGRRLLDAAIAAARQSGVERLGASMFVDNPAIHRLLLGTGLPHRRTSVGGGVDGIEIDLGADLDGPAAGVPKGPSPKRERPVETGRSARSSKPVAAVR